MAGGPYWNPQRGTWSVQYWDGKTRRVVVAKRRPGWKPGDPQPRKPPPEVVARLAKYQAIEEASKAAHRVTRGSGNQAPSLAAFLDAHAASYTNTATKTKVRHSTTKFREWCATQGVAAVGDVTPELCDQYIDYLVSRHKISTVLTERRYIAAAWTRRGRRKSAPNPWVDARPAESPPSQRRGSWTPEQFERLLAACKSQAMRDLLTIGVQIGLRATALIRLEWEDVKPPTGQGYGWIDVPPHKDKAKKGYQVPVSKSLHEILERRGSSPNRHAKYVITGRMGRPYRKRSHTDRLIRLACARAGLPEPDGPNHHMRRTFGRWAIAGHLTGKPVPVYIVSRWLGHSSLKTTLGYLDINEEDSTRFMLGEA